MHLHNKTKTKAMQDHDLKLGAANSYWCYSKLHSIIRNNNNNNNNNNSINDIDACNQVSKTMPKVGCALQQQQQRPRRAPSVLFNSCSRDQLNNNNDDENLLPTFNSETTTTTSTASAKQLYCNKLCNMSTTTSFMNENDESLLNGNSTYSNSTTNKKMFVENIDDIQNSNDDTNNEEETKGRTRIRIRIKANNNLLSLKENIQTNNITSSVITTALTSKQLAATQIVAFKFKPQKQLESSSNKQQIMITKTPPKLPLFTKNNNYTSNNERSKQFKVNSKQQQHKLLLLPNNNNNNSLPSLNSSKLQHKLNHNTSITSQLLNTLFNNLLLHYLICILLLMHSTNEYTSNIHSTTPCFTQTTKTSFASILFVNANNLIAPTIDYSHNMRILKLPATTKPGSLIYRLKGSDADPKSQLKFGVLGIEARALLDIKPVAKSWNEADVYLRSPIIESQTYNVTVFVSDGNLTTQVESTIYATPGNDYALPATSQQQQHQQSSTHNSHAPPPQAPNIETLLTTNRTPGDDGSSAAAAGPRNPQYVGAENSLSPFINQRLIFHVPESALPSDSIGFVQALESESSDLPVKFELRGLNAENFALRYVFGPEAGISRANIVLANKLDYETQNVFALKVLAINAWTNKQFDTRNVASLDIVVIVDDVQDSAPVFKNLPISVKLLTSMQINDLILKLHAEDSDYANQRQISYALDTINSPLAAYFSVNKKSGEIRLAKPMSELLANAGTQLDAIQWQMLTVIASEEFENLNNNNNNNKDLHINSYDDKYDNNNNINLWPLMSTREFIRILIVDSKNEPPIFVPPSNNYNNLIIENNNNNNNGIGSHLDNSNSNSAASFVINNKHNKVKHLRGFIDERQALNEGLVKWQIQQTASARASRKATNTNASEQRLSRSSSSSSSSLSQSTSLSNNLMQSHSLVNYLTIVDFNLGSNGTFEVSLEGNDAALFRIEPSGQVVRRGAFFVFASPLVVSQHLNQQHLNSNLNSKLQLLDADTRLNSNNNKQKQFNFDLVAKDFGTFERKVAKVKVSIELLDVNDNSPQFTQSTFTASVFENALPGEYVTTINAIDVDSQQANQSRIKFTRLIGFGSNYFNLDSSSGRVTTVELLDRELNSQFELIIEARDEDGNGRANYTQLSIKVLDKNDNAPVFTQQHYEGVLLADGSFETALFVRAFDADEQNSENSRIAYEIIAGNSNEQFVIDSNTGQILLSNSNSNQLTPAKSGSSGSSQPLELFNSQHQQQHHQLHNTRKPPLPSVITETIKPFINKSHEREIEETTNADSMLSSREHTNAMTHHPTLASRIVDGFRSARSESSSKSPSPSLQANYKISDASINNNNNVDSNDNSNKSTNAVAADDASAMATLRRLLPASFNFDSQLPALDLLLNLDSSETSQTVLPPNEQQQQQQQQIDNHNELVRKMRESRRRDIPSLRTATTTADATTLVVRAHDFGIPVKSATVRVTIHNLALSTRIVSIILNGSVDALEFRKRELERAFGFVTGSKASVESIESLSDSSSLSVARVKLALPLHTLIDLTDLNGLLTALDLPIHSSPSSSSAANAGRNSLNANPNYYYAGHQPTNGLTNTTSNTNDALLQLHNNNNNNNNHHQLANTAIADSSSSSSTTGVSNPNSATFIIEPVNSALSVERRLLVYIIVVGVCILGLLLVWLVYACTRTDQIKIIEKQVPALANNGRFVSVSTNPRLSTISSTINNNNNNNIDNELNSSVAQQSTKRIGKQDKTQTSVKTATCGSDVIDRYKSAISNNLAKQTNFNQQQPMTVRQLQAARQQQQQQQQLSRPSHLQHSSDQLSQFTNNSNTNNKSINDKLSLYNGPIWFEPMTAAAVAAAANHRRANNNNNNNIAGYGYEFAGERRATSAPTAAQNSSSLEYLHEIRRRQQNANNINSNNKLANASGQFFPNSLGIVENIAAATSAATAAAVVAATSKTNSTKPTTTTTTSNNTSNKRGSSNKRSGIKGGKLKTELQKRRNRKVAPLTTVANSKLIDVESQDSYYKPSKPPRLSLKYRNDNSNVYYDDDEDEDDDEVRNELAINDEDDDEDFLANSSDASTSLDSLMLDTNQELLGFDSTGTPIIATHTRAKHLQMSPANKFGYLPTTVESENGVTSSSNAAINNNNTRLKRSPLQQQQQQQNANNQQQQQSVVDESVTQKTTSGFANETQASNVVATNTKQAATTKVSDKKASSNESVPQSLMTELNEKLSKRRANSTEKTNNEAASLSSTSLSSTPLQQSLEQQQQQQHNNSNGNSRRSSEQTNDEQPKVVNERDVVNVNQSQPSISSTINERQSSNESEHSTGGSSKPANDIKMNDDKNLNGTKALTNKESIDKNNNNEGIDNNKTTSAVTNTGNAAVDSSIKDDDSNDGNNKLPVKSIEDKRKQLIDSNNNSVGDNIEEEEEDSSSREQANRQQRVNRLESIATSESSTDMLADMKNGDLLEKKSVFAIAYNGVMTRPGLN